MGSWLHDSTPLPPLATGAISRSLGPASLGNPVVSSCGRANITSLALSLSLSLFPLSRFHSMCLHTQIYLSDEFAQMNEGMKLHVCLSRLFRGGISRECANRTATKGERTNGRTDGRR